MIGPVARLTRWSKLLPRLLLVCCALQAALPGGIALAQAPAAAPAAPSGTLPASFGAGLQSPDQRSTRFSAYALPNKVWSLDVGALGVSTNELYGLLGVSRGFKHGFQVDLNLVHWGVGLFGLQARWNFLETRHLALAANTGFQYAHGNLIWILSDVAHDIVADSDLIAFPLGFIASAPLTSWLQLDLLAQYQFAQVWGSLGGGSSFYADSQVGVRQFFVRPTVRLFASDTTAFEFAAKLPAHTEAPITLDSTVTVGDRTRENSKSTYANVPFKDSWNFEFGVRSKLRPWLFATVRLHLGQVSKSVYGAPLYPSFGLEFRL